MSRSRSRLRVVWAFFAVFVAHFLFAGMDAVGHSYASKGHIDGHPPAPFLVDAWPAWKKAAIVLGYPGSFILRNPASTESEVWLVAIATSALWAIVLVVAWCLVMRAVRSAIPARPDSP